jgi:hypothetical protein
MTDRSGVKDNPAPSGWGEPEPRRLEGHAPFQFRSETVVLALLS